MPMKLKRQGPTAFARLLRSSGYKELDPVEKLEEMLHYKSLDQLVEDKNIYTAEGAAAYAGYNPEYIRQIAREGKLDHIKRGIADKNIQLFFLPEQLKGLFSYKKAKARA